MKTLQPLLMILVLGAAVTTLIAQPQAPTSPNAQPSVQNPASGPPATVGKPLSPDEKTTTLKELNDLSADYRNKGYWYLTLYYIFVLGSALAGALAGLFLQFDSPEKSYKRKAQILAFIGSALVIVTTAVNFKVQSAANNTADWELRQLAMQVDTGEITDKSVVAKTKFTIEQRKSQMARN